jgi:hypothetical protein
MQGGSLPATARGAAGRSFVRLASGSAIAAGIGGLLYSIAFVADAATDSTVADVLSSVLLMVTALLTLVALVGVHGEVRRVDESYALLALLLASIANAGALIHGGFDLANLVHEPSPSIDFPNAVDPRGLSAFGLSALAIALFSWLMAADGLFPGALTRLGYVLAVLLTVLYLGRLIILDATNVLVLTAALITGLVASPAWLIWTVCRSGEPPDNGYAA